MVFKPSSHLPLNNESFIYVSFSEISKSFNRNLYVCLSSQYLTKHVFIHISPREIIKGLFGRFDNVILNE